MLQNVPQVPRQHQAQADAEALDDAIPCTKLLSGMPNNMKQFHIATDAQLIHNLLKAGDLRFFLGTVSMICQ